MRISSPLSSPAMSASYLTEPLLRFAHEGLHENPKSGIARYGPLSYSSTRMSVHPDQVRHARPRNRGASSGAPRWIAQNGMSRPRGYSCSSARTTAWSLPALTPSE